MEYFNRWAFVYVGIYGYVFAKRSRHVHFLVILTSPCALTLSGGISYKFTQAGKAVFQLFNQRGWDAIINDDLIGNVLSFAALGIGRSTCLLTVEPNVRVDICALILFMIRLGVRWHWWRHRRGDRRRYL